MISLSRTVKSKDFAMVYKTVHILLIVYTVLDLLVPLLFLTHDNPNSVFLNWLLSLSGTPPYRYNISSFFFRAHQCKQMIAWLMWLSG